MITRLGIVDLTPVYSETRFASISDDLDREVEMLLAAAQWP